MSAAPTTPQTSPVTGLPVAFLATAGKVQRQTPVVTGADGAARMSVHLSATGRADLVAIVDESTNVLTTTIQK